VASGSEKDRPFRLPRPHQLEELSPDQVVAVVMRLAMEICVLRDRVRTHEQLLARHQVLSPEEIESYAPSKEESAARREASTRLIESIIDDLS
jgi:hypothetical protein